ncbi:MAG TPA: histidinol dehydrogenase, partial [Bacteroidia bacterium]|nr:histidinol dehydrogenase [Bacteroidia bacterium]
WEIAEKITNAGSVFLGEFTPESAGDYASGTNHTLPTNGWARSYSGVNHLCCFPVADLTQHNHIRILTQKGTQGTGKC